MPRVRALLAGVSAVGTLAVSASPATAAPPEPEGHPGCNGLYAAALNQFFGPIASPSGNPNAAIGPGPFLSEGGAGEDIREDRAEACG
jgi:hypothetical protein